MFIHELVLSANVEFLESFVAKVLFCQFRKSDRLKSLSELMTERVQLSGTESVSNFTFGNKEKYGRIIIQLF